MARKVDPFVFAKLFNGPRSASFLSIYTRERGEAADAPTNTVQFRVYGKEFTLASSFGLTDGNKTLLVSCGTRRIAPSGTNEGGQGWGVGRDVEMWEILSAVCKGSTENSPEGHHQMRD